MTQFDLYNQNKREYEEILLSFQQIDSKRVVKKWSFLTKDKINRIANIAAILTPFGERGKTIYLFEAIERIKTC